MPVFRFVQREVTTHEIVVRADSEEEAAEWVGGLCDDEFARSDTDWDDETMCYKESENTEVDEDLTEYVD
jgi:hypothetical protein